MKLARDTWLIFQRQMTLMVRSPIRLLVGFAQPITYLLLFAPLLKPALASMGARTYGDAYRVYVPGLLVILVLLSGLFVGFNLLAELRSGIIERSRVTPVSRYALLLGRALSEVATLLVQALIITVLAVPFGLSVRLGPLLLAYLLLALLGLVASSTSYATALLIRNPIVLGPLMNTVGQPIGLLSGVLLPLALAPNWLLSIARFNPFYWVTNGTRALFAGHAGDPVVWQSLLLLVALTGLSMFWATRLFAERVR